MIKKLFVSNFKSIQSLDLSLGRFNVIVGANAGGKSNLAQVFEFLKYIGEMDLKRSIARLAGFESLLTFGATKPLRIKVDFDTQLGYGKKKGEVLKINEFEYDFSIKSLPEKNDFSVNKEQITARYDIVNLVKKNNKYVEQGSPLSSGLIHVKNFDGAISYEVDPPDSKDIIDDYIPLTVLLKAYERDEEKIPSNTLILKTPFSLIPPWENPFGGIAVYNFDPQLAKDPIKGSEFSELHKDGRNLALLIDSIIGQENKKRKFCNLMSSLLPFVEDIGTKRFGDKSLITLREKYFNHQDLLAHLLSDGTVNITAIVMSLFFQEHKVVVIEEPERGIHPSLIQRLISLMKEASEKIQIIITTHSPEIVKYAGIENLFLIQRGDDGYSCVSRPSESEQVRVFMKNEIGLDELYVQNILTV